MGIIDEVKQKADIIDIIGQYTTLKKAGRTYRGLCPFHSEKTPSFFVYPEEQTWHCFGACNTGGDVFAFIMKKQGIGFGDALRFLADRYNIVVPVHTEQEESRSEKERLYEINQNAAQYYNSLLLNDASAESVRNYLSKRGVNLKTIVLFQLGYARNEWEALKRHLLDRGYGDSDILKAGLIIKADDGATHDRFRNKLMIPICDAKGRVTGFGSRVLDDSQPKYINSPQTAVFDKSGSLFGINHAANNIRKKDMVVIVEGYMDVIIAHQYGINNVVASMGTSINEKQINIIKKLTQNIILALDPDAAGKDAMLRGTNYEMFLDDHSNEKRNNPHLYSESYVTRGVVSLDRVMYDSIFGEQIKIVLLPKGKDPDEIIKEDPLSWNKLITESIPVMEYVIKESMSALDLTKIQDKTTFLERLLPIIESISSEVRKDHYIRYLSDLTSIDYKKLLDSLGKYKVNKIEHRDQKSLAKTVKTITSNPVEEYLLSLILQHPELKQMTEPVPPEYFESSENREIYIGWLANQDIAQLREILDNTIKEHLELILGRNIPATQIEKKYNDCSLRLREKYLKNLKRKEEMVLNLERETGGTDAELAILREQGIDISEHLKTVFIRRGQFQQR